MKKKYFWGGLSVAGLSMAVFALAACIRTQSLTLRLPKQGNRLVFASPVAPGDRFSVSYRHSVEKTRVRGVFQVSDHGRILAVETWMASVGTGLPNTFPGRTRKEGSWMVVDEKLAPVADFRFFVVPENRSVLSKDDLRVRLNDFPPGTLILIGLEPVPWLVGYLGIPVRNYILNNS